MQRLGEFTFTGTKVLHGFADLGKGCEFVFDHFSFLICWAIRHPSFSADGGWLFSVIVVSERKIQMFLSRTTGHERLESEGRGEMPYGLWRLLSQRKKSVALTEVASLGGVFISNYIEVCLVVSFDPHFSMIHT